MARRPKLPPPTAEEVKAIYEKAACRCELAAIDLIIGDQELKIGHLKPIDQKTYSDFLMLLMLAAGVRVDGEKALANKKALAK